MTTNREGQCVPHNKSLGRGVPRKRCVHCTETQQVGEIAKQLLFLATTDKNSYACKWREDNNNRTPAFAKLH